MMKVVQLKSETIKELRAKRYEIMQKMIEKEEGSLLVLKTSYLSSDRKNHLISYALFTIFFDLWERFNMETWSYTFDKEGLIFYIKLEEEAIDVKNVLVHFEDHHPLGFSIVSDVFNKNGLVCREDLGLDVRKDFYFKKDQRDLMLEDIDDFAYETMFKERIEEFIFSGEIDTVFSNIIVYAYVGAYTKPLGFGMYGPNYRGSNEQMNFDKFIHLLRSYKEDTLKLNNINSKDVYSIQRYQQAANEKIKQAVLTQDSYYYTVFMTSTLLFSFKNSSSYTNYVNEVQSMVEKLHKIGVFSEETGRYDSSLKAFRDMFKQYVPYYQKNQSIIGTLLFIMSRHDDYAVHCFNGDKTLKKAQFLAKNLVHKEDKWETMNDFCISNYLYPYEVTTILVGTLMLDLIQRNFLKLKLILDNK